MADFDLKSDEEKAEELKAWWKENGLSVIAGVAITIAGMFGYKYWQQYQLDQSEGASRLFYQLSKAGPNSPEAEPILKKLNDNYSGSAYASLAALRMAKADCEAGKTDSCITQLRKAAESSQESIATVAKIRLARALVSAGKLDEAKKIISENFPKSFASLIAEIKGDIYYAENNIPKAREAYDEAILSSGGEGTQLLKLKRDDLGNTAKTGDTPKKGA